LHWHKGEQTIHERPSIFDALAKCGMPMEPVFCGGDKRTLQEREQWASGCNFVAMRPGVILSYQRNEATLHELTRMGFRIIAGTTPGVDVMRSGVTLGATDSVLTDRAAEFLATGPANSQALISHVCQLPGAPLNIAEHMAAALFAGHVKFARLTDGRWRLRDP